MTSWRRWPAPRSTRRPPRRAGRSMMITTPAFVSSGRDRNPRAVPVVDPVNDVLEAMASAEVDQETAAEGGSLDDDYDARLRVVRQIVVPRGQARVPAARPGA